MDDEREERNLLELDLRAAIEREEIRVVYQPVVRATDRQVSGVEALARWTRPGYGPSSRKVFITDCRKYWPYRSSGALRIALCLPRSAPMAGAFPFGECFSRPVFRDPALVRHVGEILRESDIEPGRLTLELTETYFIQNPARARLTLDRLREMGIKVALDDFRRGLSQSVGYLRQFGFDRLKN